MRGLLFGDNYYENPRTSIGRATGVHRIATLLRKRGIEVEVIDFFNSWSKEELEQFILKQDQIDFVGFGLGLSTLHEELVEFTVAKVRSIFPNAKSIAGGMRPLENANYYCIDLYFKGHAEGAIEDIIKFLHRGKFDPFKVQLLKTHDVKQVIDCTRLYPKFDLSDLKTVYTENDGITANEALVLEIGKGCVFSCKFCSFPLTGKNKNDYIRTKEDIKQELIENYQNWGTTRYTLSDDTFNDNQLKLDMLYEITQELDFDVHFLAYARIDLMLGQKGSLDMMVKSGFRGFYFGIESMNETSSRAIGKHLVGDRLKNYLLSIRETYPDIHLTGSFIIGLPDEPIDVFKENIQWCLDNNAFDSYKIFPMSIPIDDGVNYIAPWSRTWKECGYEYTTDQEIEDTMKKYGLAPYVDVKAYMNQSIPWKNKHMNFLESMVYSGEVAKMVHSVSTVGGWAKFAQSFDEPSLEDSMFVLKSEEDWNSKKFNANKFVSDYKIMKLANGNKSQNQV